MGRKIGIGLIISLSAFMFGYCIMEITVIPISEIAVYYNITINQDVALSILIGILPLTAILGAISANLMMKKFRRLSGIYIFTIINCVAIGLVNINMFSTLLVGRGLEGICIGFYSALGPIYLREIAPVELRKLLGLFFSLGKVGGTVFAIIL
jgi:MFS family permease